MDDSAFGVVNAEVAALDDCALGDADTAFACGLDGAGVDDNDLTGRCITIGGALGDGRDVAVGILVEVGAACGVLEEKGDGIGAAGRDGACVVDGDVAGAAGGVAET